MSQFITIKDARLAIAQLSGRRVIPSGSLDNWDINIQWAFDHAWRYYKWSWTVATDTLQAGSDNIAYLPKNFDYGSWTKIAGMEKFEIDDVDVTTDPLDGVSDNSKYIILFDDEEDQYYVKGNVDGKNLFYQKQPPKIDFSDESNPIKFVSSMVLGMGAVINIKKGDNPNRYSASPDWDAFHVELDLLVSEQNRNRGGRLGRNLYEINNWRTGATS